MLVDGSGSICDNDPSHKVGEYYCNNWQEIVDFMEDVIDILTPGRDQVGVAFFSNVVIPIIELGSWVV